MHRAGLVLLGGALACVLAALLVAATDDRRLAFTLGVAREIPAVPLDRGQQACQGPIGVSADATRVRFAATTGGPLEVAVRSVTPPRLLGTARARLGGDARIPKISKGDRIMLCIRNLGTARAALMGDTGTAVAASSASLDGRPLPADLALEFDRESPRSLLSLVPDVFERAALFKAGWVGPWLFWVLAGLIVFGLPLLLYRALAAALE